MGGYHGSRIAVSVELSQGREVIVSIITEQLERSRRERELRFAKFHGALKGIMFLSTLKTLTTDEETVEKIRIELGKFNGPEAY